MLIWMVSGNLIASDKNLHTFNENHHKLATIHHVTGNWNISIRFNDAINARKRKQEKLCNICQSISELN